MSAWSWHPVLELLRSERLIGEEFYERMGANGGGATVSETLALQFAFAIQRKVEGMAPGERLRGDLSITSAPRPPWVFSPKRIDGDADWTGLYSVDRECLAELLSFLKRS